MKALLVFQKYDDSYMVTYDERIPSDSSIDYESLRGVSNKAGELEEIARNLLSKDSAETFDGYIISSDILDTEIRDMRESFIKCIIKDSEFEEHISSLNYLRLDRKDKDNVLESRFDNTLDLNANWKNLKELLLLKGLLTNSLGYVYDDEIPVEL